ncbi:MAG: 4'-phosphopantetheinyl transferase superfamily protein [Bacilli bacterium]|nr:4'-phosphopantetheinyl transferase superfamily protein [Bacilli bacterium]
MIKIYLEDISIIDSEAKFNAYFDKLPKYRQDKILALKNEKDKYLSLLAGKLLSDGLRDLNLYNYINKIEVEENGKPYIPGNPIYFSISHSGTKAIVIFSNDEVGCDIQIMKGDTISLAEKYFTEEEQNEINNSDDPVKSFYKLWTLKECYMKTSGKGLSLGLKNIDVYNKDYISKSYVIDQIYMVSYIARDR